MPKVSASQQLAQRIIELEKIQARQAVELKYQFHEALEHLRPANLIKHALKETMSGAKTGLVDTALGMGTGFITKKILTLGSRNPIIKLAGMLVEVGVANLVSKHPDAIKSLGGSIFNKFFGKKKAESTETGEQ